MNSYLSPICESLDNKRDDIDAHTEILLQYLDGFDTDLSALSNLAHDPELPLLLQHVFQSLLRTPFPSPSESEIPAVQQKSLNFLTFLCLNHPDLLSTIASLAPLDELIISFFIESLKVNNDIKEKDDINSRKTTSLEDPQLSHLFPIFQFLAAISCSSAISLSSTESLNCLLTVLVSTISTVQQLSVFAISIIANFSRNSTAFQSYIKSVPNFSAIKKELASFLSSNDHSLVVTSLAAVSVLFSRGIDKETAMKVSLAAIFSPSENYQFITTIAATVVLQYSDEIDISQKDCESLLKSAMNAQGMRAYVIYKLLIEINGNGHKRLLALLQSNSNFFNSLIQSILECEFGFVTIAGANFLLVLFEMNPISSEIDISEPFTKAMKIILSGKVDDIDKLDSLLLIVRLLISMRESMTQIIQVLQENEDLIFIAFQRQIELNNSFISIHFFLFIFAASHFFKHWLNKLRELVIDSQFSALLVHVLETSLNRRTINDALEVIQIVLGGITPKHLRLDQNLSFTLASGFFLLNRQKKQEEQKSDQRYVQLQRNFTDHLQGCNAEKICYDKTILNLKKELEQYRSHSIVADQKVSDLSAQNDLLNKKLQKKKEKLIKAIQDLKLSESKLNDLSLLVCQHENDMNNSTQQSEKLRTKIQKLKQIEVSKEETEKSNEQLRQKIKELELQNDGTAKELENMINVATKERNSRKELDKLLNEAQSRINQLNSSIEYEKQGHDISDKRNEKLELIINQKTENETKLTTSVTKMNNEINNLKQKIENLEQENHILKTICDKRCKKIGELRRERKELATLAQLIHKITDGKLENVESIVGMMDIEQQTISDEQ